MDYGQSHGATRVGGAGAHGVTQGRVSPLRRGQPSSEHPSLYPGSCWLARAHCERAGPCLHSFHRGDDDAGQGPEGGWVVRPGTPWSIASERTSPYPLL